MRKQTYKLITDNEPKHSCGSTLKQHDKNGIVYEFCGKCSKYIELDKSNTQGSFDRPKTQFTIKKYNNTPESDTVYCWKWKTRIEAPIISRLIPKNVSHKLSEFVGPLKKDIIKLLESPESIPLFRQKSKIENAGYGMFAAQNIKANSLILPYIGEIRPLHGAFHGNSLFNLGVIISEMEGDELNQFSIVIDPSVHSNEGKFINMLPDELCNCQPYIGVIELKGVYYPIVIILSKIDISQGEEVTYNYGCEYFFDEVKSLKRTIEAYENDYLDKFIGEYVEGSYDSSNEDDDDDDVAKEHKLEEERRKRREKLKITKEEEEIIEKMCGNKCEEIGHGGFSYVYKVWDEYKGCFYAIKKTLKNEHEVKVHLDAQKEGITQILPLIHYRLVGEYYFLAFPKLAKALEWLHSKNLIHGDLRLQNVLISRKPKKIFLHDFGVCAESNKYIWKSSRMHIPPCVSPQYWGPESDVWSLGIIFFELFVDYEPEAENTDKFTLSYANKEYVTLKYGRDACELFEGLLNPCGALRFNIKSVLQSNFLRKMNEEDEETYKKNLQKVKKAIKKRKQQKTTKGIKSMCKFCKKKCAPSSIYHHQKKCWQNPKKQGK